MQKEWRLAAVEASARVESEVKRPPLRQALAAADCGCISLIACWRPTKATGELGALE